MKKLILISTGKLLLLCFIAIVVFYQWGLSTAKLEYQEQALSELNRRALSAQAAISEAARDTLALVNTISDHTAHPETQTLEQKFRVSMKLFPEFYQVRFIDRDGFEVVRLDNKNGIILRTADEALQNKKERYYFTKAISLPANSVYLSKLDFNQEHGQVELPHKPTVRLASPVIVDGIASGIIVINLDMKMLLTKMTRSDNPHQSGYYQLFSSQAELLSANQRGEFLSNNTTLVPQPIWDNLVGKLHQHSLHKDEIFSSIRIIPAMYLEQLHSENNDVNIVTDELNWYLVNRQSVNQLYHKVYFETWLAIVVAFLILMMWNYLSRKSIRAQDIANDSLRRTHMLGNILRLSSDLVFITDTTGRISYVNHAFEETTGYGEAELLGKSPNILKSGLHDETFYARLWGALCDGKEFHALFTNKKKNGDLFYNQASLSPVKDHEGDITGYVCIGKDISDSHTLKLALYDNLTGLCNRAMLFDRLRYAIAFTKRNKSGLALFYLDLDGFKQVNDRYGHEMGDDLLIEAANRIKKVFRESDTLARLGGDEFVVMVQDPVNQADIEHIGQKCLDIFSQTWLVNGQQIEGVGVSIGITIYNGVSDIEPEELLQKADFAMYQTKQNGKNHYTFYNGKESDSKR